MHNNRMNMAGNIIGPLVLILTLGLVFIYPICWFGYRVYKEIFVERPCVTVAQIGQCHGEILGGTCSFTDTKGKAHRVQYPTSPGQRICDHDLD